MTPFDRSVADYEKLRSYFSGLTNAYQLTNQLEITEEEDSSETAMLTLEWTLCAEPELHRACAVGNEGRKMEDSGVLTGGAV